MRTSAHCAQWLKWHVLLQVDPKALVGMTHVFTFSDGITYEDLMVVALLVNESEHVKVGGGWQAVPDHVHICGY